MMKSTYDIRQLLKRFGIYIYTGTKMGDIEVMENEIRDLYQYQLIDVSTYRQALLVLRSEKG